MGIINWFMQRSMLKEARRLAKEIALNYPDKQSREPNLFTMNTIIDNTFNREALDNMSEESKKRFETCCETINGFCYMMALDIGRLKGLMNFRSLQFTYYMDKALEAQGFAIQSKEQKERILEVMGLRIDNWEKFSGDEV